MSNNERPGVYTSYEVSSSLRGSSNGAVVGLAAAAGAGAVKTTVTDQAAAIAAFGSGAMAALAGIALANGAAAVCCVPVSGSDYAAAFSVLMAEESVKFMLCDSRNAAVHAAMLTAIQAANEKCRYRIGVVETGDTTRTALVSAAAALNSERMVLVSHHTATVGAAAAAVCGLMAGETDPAVPLNGAALQGIGGIGDNFSDSDLNLLVQGGVLPLETVGGYVCVIRGITTRCTTAGTADATWREVNTILIVNTVIPAIRDTLRVAFAQAKNNAQTRGAIRTRVIIALEDFLRREIIDGYDNVTVAASASDPTVCEVGFGFTVTHGLNIIELSAHITV